MYGPASGLALTDEQKRWFAPVLEALRTPEAPGAAFLQAGQPCWIARAPGRLDVMGGIADYSGARVLEMPLDRGTCVALQPDPRPICEATSMREGQAARARVELRRLISGDLSTPEALGAWSRSRPANRWAAYVLGVVQYVAQRARKMPAGGFRLLVLSDVPEGKGVSSSAALEVAAMMATAAYCGLPMEAAELAAACQQVENQVVGAPCGIMDQMTCACGEQGRLLRLLCRPARIEGYVPIPEGFRFYGIDSGIRHAVSGADYGTVRAAAFMGYRILAEAAGLPVREEGGRVHVEDHRWGGYLAALTPEEFARDYEALLPETMEGGPFLRAYGGATDTATRVVAGKSYPVRAATAHPIGEHARVTAFAEHLAALPGDPAAHAPVMGALMYAAHESYSRCGLGSDGTDRLVELARQAGPERGVYGAKITGGGSGGTVAVFGRADAAEAVRGIAAAYTRETGRQTEIFEGSGPGAVELGIAIVTSLNDF